MEKRLHKGQILYGAMAFISTCAFCVDLSGYNAEETVLFKKIQQILPAGNQLQWFFVWMAIFLMYGRIFEKTVVCKKTERGIKVISGVFAIFSYIGIMCENFEQWRIGKTLFCVSLLLVLGYSFAIYGCLRFLFYCYEKKEKREETEQKKWELLLFEQHVYLSHMIIMFLCWLPFLICFYPGIANWDGMRSLTVWFGKIPWGNHHPVLISVIMGVCMEIGQKIANDNFGIFVYSFLQTVIIMVTACNIQIFLKKVKAPYWLRKFVLVYFAIMPFWQATGYSLLKDPLYCMMLTNFTLVLAYMVIDLEKYSGSWFGCILMTVLALLCCFTRNNGVYVMIILVPVLFFWIRKRRQGTLIMGKVLFPFLFSIVVFFGCSNVLYPMLSIESDGMQESLSLLFQQTARYVMVYEEELTQEEKQILNTTFNNAEEIGQVYNPSLSDPIKNKLNKQITTSQFLDYLGMWWKQLWKHPAVYFEAFFYQTGAYYGPDYTGELGGIGANYNMITLEGVNPDNYLNLYFHERYSAERFGLIKWAYFIKHIPGIGLIYSPAFYQWITIVCMLGVMVYRKKEYAVIFIPSIVTMLVALLSPVNGSLRYYMPVMAIAPILMGILLKKEEADK